jgi:hypothetical protein
MDVCAEKYIDLKLKFRNNGSQHEKRTAQYSTVTSVLINLLKSSGFFTYRQV